MTTPDTVTSGSRPTHQGIGIGIGLGVAAVVSFVLGYLGLDMLLSSRPDVEGGRLWTDVAYYTLQLFLIDSAPLQSAGNLPVVLEVARFLAPAVTAATLAAAVVSVLGSTWYSLRLRLLRRHTVVCGSGTPAWLVARAVSREERTCVVIDGSDSRAAPWRDRSFRDDTVRGLVLHIGGDPRRREVLRAARADSAREVIVLGARDPGNVDVTGALRAVVDPAAPPQCIVETSPAVAAAALVAHDMSSEPPLYAEFFDPLERAASRLLESYLPPVGDGAVVVVIGSGALRDRVLEALASRSPDPAPPIPLVSVPAGAADELVVPDVEPALVLVCVDGDVVPIGLGLAALRRFRRHAVDIVVATTRSATAGASAAGTDFVAGQASRARMQVVNLAEHVYSVPSLRAGIYTDMARAAHERYVAAARARGETERSNPSSVTWEQLPAHLRRSNLEQARSVREKLRELGYTVAPIDSPDDGAVPDFDTTEIEWLARAEHQRWLDERRAGGWRTGARDDRARRHPDLVAWSDLTEQSREKDRAAVRSIPEDLRAAGLAILRSAGPP